MSAILPPPPPPEQPYGAQSQIRHTRSTSSIISARSRRSRRTQGSRIPAQSSTLPDLPPPVPPKPANIVLKTTASAPAAPIKNKTQNAPSTPSTPSAVSVPSTPSSTSIPETPSSPNKFSAALRSFSLTKIPLFNLSNNPKAKEREQLEEALRLAVTNSGSPSTVLVGETTLHVCTENAKYSWLSHLFSKEALERFFVHEHAGNYVVVRETGVQIFEEMPIYARIGMHLLFYGSWQIRLLGWSRLKNVLREESVRQGKIYDSTDPDLVRTQIAAFVHTYKIDLTELLQPDLQAYQTFNDFFSRRLRPDARLPESPSDHSVVVSSADCRITVWPTWSSARRLWVKGRGFTLSKLVKSSSLVKAIGPNPCLAILRLAPQDYHRFHAPVSGTIMSITTIPGEYYTVNPQAINQRLDVLTANVRSICAIRAQVSTADETHTRDVTIAVVAVGALLVGSIVWAKGEGERIEKGEELGWFRYGGSTVVLVMPEGLVFDMDLMNCSSDKLEMLVKAGEQIGRFGVL